MNGTVLRDASANAGRTEKALDYLFRLPRRLRFSAHGKARIPSRRRTKTLINASVLGLIFEKISVYQDGSFFTPVHHHVYVPGGVAPGSGAKFRESPALPSSTGNFARITVTSAARTIPKACGGNRLVNSIKVCDPAVGSILPGLFPQRADRHQERAGHPARQPRGQALPVRVEVENDELVSGTSAIPTNCSNTARRARQPARAGSPLPRKANPHRNCLFGVDINPNSVKICRLRLWIEFAQKRVLQGKSEGGRRKSERNGLRNLRRSATPTPRLGTYYELQEASDFPLPLPASGNPAQHRHQHQAGELAGEPV